MSRRLFRHGVRARAAGNGLRAILGGLLLGAAAHANAGLLHAQARIDAATLRVTQVSGDAALSFTGAATTHLASALTPFDESFGFGPLPQSFSLLDEYPNGAAMAGAASDAVSAQASAEGAGFASAVGFLDQGYTLSGAGALRIEADYLIMHDLEPGTGYTNSYVEIVAGDGTRDVTDEVLLTTLAGAVPEETTEDGTLSLLLDVDGSAPGRLILTATVLADTEVAAVPLPASAWLLLGALAPVAALRRRRSVTRAPH